MNYKRLLVSSIVVMTVLTSQANAKELQAQVQRTTTSVPNIYSQQNVTNVKSVSQPYPEIAKLIEYNHCDEADVKIK